MNVGKIPFFDFPSIGSALTASQGQRISLPVSPASYIYSQFRHVSGVPAADGVQGVSIAKLSILDAVLNEISRINETPSPSLTVQGNTADKHLGNLIEHFQAQVSQAHSTQASNPYHASAPLVGMAVSVQV
ncbi:MAG: hypothetical protein FWF29_12230 [Treponema sp.]|nr:hypothetical protein [Treponema sp.]